MFLPPGHLGEGGVLPGVQGEGEVEAHREGESEILALGGQVPAKVQALGNQRVFFPRLQCGIIRFQVILNKTELSESMTDFVQRIYSCNGWLEQNLNIIKICKYYSLRAPPQVTNKQVLFTKVFMEGNYVNLSQNSVIQCNFNSMLQPESQWPHLFCKIHLATILDYHSVKILTY